MIKIGLIGYGYWGPKLARNFVQSDKFELVAIAEELLQKQSLARNACPGTEITSNGETILNSPEIDSVVIATPAASHYEIAKKALENGKHVLLTKPFVTSSADAEKLIELAYSKNLTLMVDHTFLYTPQVERMKESVENNELGNLYYYDSVRINLGAFQKDVSVIWDLAPHDLSILDHLVSEQPICLSTVGTGHFDKNKPEIAYVNLQYQSGFIAHIHVNWLSPVKIRKTILAGSKQMLVWDDLSVESKLKFYDKGVSVQSDEEKYRYQADYRFGDMFSPTLPFVEALANEVSHFADCIINNLQPRTNGESALRVLKLLEAADESYRENGKSIKLKTTEHLP